MKRRIPLVLLLVVIPLWTCTLFSQEETKDFTSKVPRSVFSETLEDGSSTTLFSGDISPIFPKNDLNSDYGELELEWLSATSQWRLSTDIAGTQTTVATVDSTATGGSFTRPNHRISNQVGGQADFTIDRYVLETTPIPEPTTLALLGIGAMLLGRIRRRGE